TITGYDTKGRVIYTASKNNYLNTTDIVETEYDFGGKVVQTKATHKRTGNADIVTIDDFEYDHEGRLLRQKQTIGGQAQETLVDNTYDDLGQLEKKKVGGGLQTVDYTYNVRGWLKAINNPSSLGSDLWAFKINYNTVSHSGTALFNGNIAETEWRTANTDNSLKWYRYGYDPLNRITSATDNTGHYNLVGITYDKNGNIQTLNRKGHTAVDGNGQVTSFTGTMDNLDYNYFNSETSNRLYKVRDDGSDTHGFRDSGADGQDYWYDANGNMTRDDNKGVTDITYNHLNLPTDIATSQGTISYIYDAAGTKLQKTVGGSVTDYVGNYVYQNGNLEFFSHPEGYVMPDGNGGYDYVYQYKDHLGNIRLTYTDGNGNGSIDPNAEIVEENNYYPFGLKHKGYNNVTSSYGNSVAQKWKFGGKEYEDSFNESIATYDFGARNYDPALGRWMNLDPLAEQMRRHSPYNFVFNNPLRFIDPDGMSPDDIVIRGKDIASGEYRDAVIIKSEKIDITLDVENLVLPPSVQDPGTNSENSPLNAPIELGGFDQALQLAENTFGQTDAITIDIGGQVVAGGGAAGNVQIAAILQGDDAGGAFLYGPSHSDVQIGFAGGVGIELGAVFSTTDNFDRNSLEGTTIGVDGSYGPVSGSFSLGVDGPFDWDVNYVGASLGVGAGVPGGRAFISQSELITTIRKPNNEQ
ncbi:RHS repeat domain-containing protein, partial [Flagellimonas hadalis]